MAKNKPKIVGDRAWIRYLTVAVSLFGCFISLYSFYEEKRMQYDKTYKPFCDLTDRVRCSKALMSKWGMGFGFLGSVFGEKHTLNQPNTLYGAMFYALMAGLGYARNAKASLVQLNLAFISVLVSGYLAYHLFFNLEELCPVCIVTYVVNIIILLLSIFKGKPHIAEPRDYKSAVGKNKKTDGEAFPPLTKSDGSPGGKSTVDSSGGKSYAQATKVDGKAAQMSGGGNVGKSYAAAAKPSLAQVVKGSNKK